MTTLITLGLLLMVYLRFRNNYLSRVTMEYSYRLYDLRDALRDQAINGVIDKNDWRFRYLDGSISKMVSELDSLNIFTILMLTRAHKNDLPLKAYSAKVTSSMKEHKQLDLIYHEYAALVTSYAISKHFLLRWMVGMGIWSLIRSFKVVQKLRNSFKKAVDRLRILPETSTSDDFLHLA